MGKKKQEQEEQLRRMREERKQAELAKKKQENRLMWIIICAVLAVVVIAAAIPILISSLNGNEADTTEMEDLSDSPIKYDLASPDTYVVSKEATQYVKLNVSYSDDNGQRHNGDIIIKLDPTNAPITVANFQKLVGEGFYDGLIFHRVIEDFMIQGGDPEGNGSGGSDEEIEGEFSKNGVDNKLSHKRGVVSMARQGAETDALDALYYNTASSQFFIVHEDSTFLDGKYASFGEVVFGMTSVDGIAAMAVNTVAKPLKEAKIVSAVFINYLGNEFPA